MSGDSNFSKIHKLLDRINFLLRNVFLKRWNEETGEDWSLSPTTVFTNGIGRKMFEKAGKIQKEAIKSGDVNRWDTTLLTDILLQFNSSRNKSQDKQERKFLGDIKIVRNKLFHHPSINIEDVLFEELWHQAVPVLTFFGGSVSDIQILESPSLPDETANIQKAAKLKEDGNAACKNGKFVEAVELYTTAISCSGVPTTEVAILYSNRSAAYLGMSRQNESRIELEFIYLALQDAKEAVNLNRTWYRGYFRVGNAYVALEKFDEALEFFDSALAFGPGRPEIVTARDNCRLKQGQSRRKEHLDPAQMPASENEFLKKLSTRLGLKDDNTTAKKLLELYSVHGDELIPGSSHVQQAHKFVLNGDYKRAASLFAKAASLQNAEGLYNLGLMYKHGRGVQQDFKMSIKLMHQAASQSHLLRGVLRNVGVAEAEHSLGLTYQEGIGVKEDCAEAARWYKRASDHGFSGSSNNLAQLYMSGRGVPLNPERGVQYWKLSASQGNVLAMQSLANYYLEIEQDPGQAREYFNRAVKHGSLDAKLNAADFEERMNSVEEEHKKVELELKEFERSAGINSEGLSLKDRTKNLINAVDPEAVNLAENLQKLYVRGEKASNNPLGWGPGIEFDYDEVKKNAQNGSKTARKILTARQHFVAGASLLLEHGPRPSQQVQQSIIHEFAECFRVEETVVMLSLDLASHLSNVIDSVLESLNPNETSVLDKEARICYGYMNPHNLKRCADFVKCSKLKYPEEVAFHRLHSSLFGFLKQYDDGLREVVKSLELFPNDIELSYCRAVQSRLLEASDRDDVISAYERFISLAPPDHRKIPESFYAIANEYVLKSFMHSFQSDTKLDLSWTSAVEGFYHKGLAAEGIQLPCYLPYESEQKELLIQVCMTMIEKMKIMNNSDMNTVKPVAVAVHKPVSNACFRVVCLMPK